MQILNNLIQNVEVTNKNDKQLIISLTSHPGRIAVVSQTVKTLLVQTMIADKIILWLAKEQFPNLENDLPLELLELCEMGLKIRWCEEDLKPHKKYYYTMKEYPKDIIITVDDDILYEKTLVEDLYKSYSSYPTAVSAMRTHLITFDTQGDVDSYDYWLKIYKEILNKPSMKLISIGIGGVLYPPNSMHGEVFNLDAMKETCLMADDLWLKVMQIMNHTPTVLAKKNPKIKSIDDSQDVALWKTNLREGRNDIQLSKILEIYNSYFSEEDTLVSRIYESKLKSNE